MTGEELDRKFFEEVLGWEWKEREDALPGHMCWHDGQKEINVLPKLHKSLDLQEEWVWPELIKQKFYDSHIERLEINGVYKCWLPEFWNDSDYDQTICFGTGKTKAEAQLSATLTALMK